jgi:hypothetical protein
MTFASERQRVAHARTAQDLGEKIQRDHLAVCERVTAWIDQIRSAGGTDEEIAAAGSWFARTLTNAGLPVTDSPDRGRAPRLIALDLIDQGDR